MQFRLAIVPATTFCLILLTYFNNFMACGLWWVEVFVATRACRMLMLDAVRFGTVVNLYLIVFLSDTVGFTWSLCDDYFSMTVFLHNNFCP